MSSLPTVKLRYLLISLAVLAADQWTKWWVERALPLHDPFPVVPGLNLTHVRNTGVAFGLFAGAEGEMTRTLLLTALGIVALTIVLVYFWRTPAEDRTLLVSLALILGGAVGNLMDRIAAGAVTDFIDAYVGTYHWHTFNVADTAITIGIGLMLLDVLGPGHESGDRAPLVEGETGEA